MNQQRTLNVQIDEAHSRAIKLLLQPLLHLQVIESYRWRADTLILRIVYLHPAALRAHPVENLQDGQEDDVDQQEDTRNG